MPDVDSQRKPLIADTLIPGLNYSAAPPRLGGDIQDISIAKFMETYRKTGGQPFQWTETIWSNPLLIRQLNLVDDEKLHEELRPYFESCLRNPSQLTSRLVLSFIDESVGFGVFARERIEAFKVVLVYAGIHHYPVAEPSSYVLGTYSVTGSIDGAKLGGMARFVQHMPTSMHERYHHTYLDGHGKGRKDWLTGSNFALRGTQGSEEPMSITEYERRYQEAYPHLPVLPDSEHTADIATANLQDDLYLMDGVPFLFFYSNRVIEVGEQLGLNYGSGYWTAHGRTPLLFNKAGGVSDVQLKFDQYNKAGLGFFQKQDYAKAYEAWVNALQLVGKLCLIQSERRNLLAKLHNNLGSCCRDDKKYTEAIEHFGEALDHHMHLESRECAAYKRVANKKIACENKLRANQENKEAVSLYKKGQFLDALSKFKKVLRGNEVFLGGKLHLDLALAHWNLSSCYLRLHRNRAAAQHAKHAYDIRIELLGDKHEETQKVRARLMLFFCMVEKGVCDEILLQRSSELVTMGEAVVSNGVGSSPQYLVTYGVANCFVLIINHGVSDLSLLAHISPDTENPGLSQTNALDYFTERNIPINELDVVLLGGWKSEPSSRETGEALRNYWKNLTPRTLDTSSLFARDGIVLPSDVMKGFFDEMEQAFDKSVILKYLEETNKAWQGNFFQAGRKDDISQFIFRKTCEYVIDSGALPAEDLERFGLLAVRRSFEEGYFIAHYDHPKKCCFPFVGLDIQSKKCLLNTDSIYYPPSHILTACRDRLSSAENVDRLTFFDRTQKKLDYETVQLRALKRKTGLDGFSAYVNKQDYVDAVVDVDDLGYAKKLALVLGSSSVGFFRSSNCGGGRLVVRHINEEELADQLYELRL